MLEAEPATEKPGRKWPHWKHWVLWPSSVVPLLFVVWFFSRHSAVKGKAVELASVYNAWTTDSTNVRNDRENPDNLEEFPLGENEFAGIRFVVNGIILLNGRNPDEAQGFALNKRCRRLHLLHGTTGKMPDGTMIARCVLHYASGQQEEIAIKYGEHVRDWWQRPGDPQPEAPLTVAWNGQNRLTRREGASLNVYLSTFENPRPKDEIQKIDFISANTKCSPFFLGLNTE